jgi:hypothetical protein
MQRSRTENGWNEPVLVTGSGAAKLPEAAAATDRLHLVWRDGWSVYYSSGTASGGKEEAQPRQVSEPAGATVLHGILRLHASASSTLLDASGRTVITLKAGANDVSRLAPGVYFILTPHPVPLPQGAREPSSTISKVLIAR